MSTAYDWTLIAGESNPHATLKSANYCSLKDTVNDAELFLRAKAVTARMIRYLNSPDWVDNTNPPGDLQEACLTQVTYEYKQRETPGLSSVTFKDGTINKFAVNGMWLPQVKQVLDQYRRITLIETNSGFVN